MKRICWLLVILSVLLPFFGTNNLFAKSEVMSIYGSTTRVSVSSDGWQGYGASRSAAISAKGRYIAFESSADTLVVGVPNYLWDIYVHDGQTGETTRVSNKSDGSLGSGFYPSISGDGRFVAFLSSSSLVSDDTNHEADVYVHDRQTSVTERVSVATDGSEQILSCYRCDPPSISANGRFVAFTSNAFNLVRNDTNNYEDVFVHDRLTGVTERVSITSDGSQANCDSFINIRTNLPFFPYYWDVNIAQNAYVSADGHYIAFTSCATNLVSNDTNGFDDVFVHDRQTGMTERVSIASDGTQANAQSWVNSISADGQVVVFNSFATNLVPCDTNGYADIFVHDRRTGETTRVSVASVKIG
ncbi:MAG: hypothetical protein M1281_04025 [Chloroflexi bacterium]|nr:hypothetical protein [Chloroflexota bacterium]